MLKNGTPASPATARASSVLPVPGGPTSKQPRGIFAPMDWYLAGLARKSLISCISSTASSTPATSAKRTSGRSSMLCLALALPKFICELFAFAIWLNRKNSMAPMRMMGSSVMRMSPHGLGVFTSYLISGCWAIRSDSELPAQVHVNLCSWPSVWDSMSCVPTPESGLPVFGSFSVAMPAFMASMALLNASAEESPAVTAG